MPRSQPRKPALPDSREAETSARDRTILEHLPLVKAIAIRVHESLPVHLDVDDLIHAGVVGLIDAVAKYRPEKRVAFSSYAKHRIKGAILDSLRQLDWASRDMRRRQKQVEAAARELCASLQREPTEAEMAHKLGIDLDRWRQIATEIQCMGLVSSSTRRSDQEDLPAPDYPADEGTQPDTMCARGQMHKALSRAIQVLPRRYQQVVILYYTKDLTMREIGTVMGVNESRVSQIHKSALEKMSVALQAAGIKSAGAFEQPSHRISRVYGAR